MHRLYYKSDEQIVREWDALAGVRLRQILSGADLTFSRILLPEIRRLLSGELNGSMLDAGCGVGVLSHRLAKQFREIVGVDPSKQSVQLADMNKPQNANFYAAFLEDYATQSKQKFDVVIANMVLMDVLRLDQFLAAVSQLLKGGGCFIFSITHPCFWPVYYGYSDADWFCYQEENIIEGSFRISNEPDCRLVSTHVHRPLSFYFASLRSVGLTIETLLEPLPSPETEALYPAKWTAPRYLVAKCVKAKRTYRKSAFP